MAIAFEEYTPKSNVLLGVFVGKKTQYKGYSQKKYFLFAVGSVCRLERFTTGSRNSLKDFRKSQMRKRRCGSNWYNSQRLLCCRFRSTGKATGQGYQCWWRICREINVFFNVWISHVLRLISIFDPFTASHSYVHNNETRGISILTDKWLSKNVKFIERNNIVTCPGFCE
jgi:hypothetical protein